MTEHESVLQDWVTYLPLRHQGTLLTGIRGCDLAAKNPTTLDSAERRLTAFLRYCVMNPADSREVGITGSFFLSEPPPEDEWKPSELGHYPLHWFSHLMHCYEVVGYRHPDPDLRREALRIYERLVESLHLNPETSEQMQVRLTEDRMANGTVVS